MRRAGAVLFILTSPFLLIAAALGTFYGAARHRLTARADSLEHDLQECSLRESRRTPLDWAPYRDCLARLRSDPERERKQCFVSTIYLEDLQDCLAWTGTGCSFKGWTASTDYGFDNRHSPFVTGGIPHGTPVRTRLLSSALTQDFFRGGGYGSAFRRSAAETKLHYVWHSELPTQQWTPASLKEARSMLERLDSARPSLREEIETEFLLRCRDVLEVLRTGKDPEHLLNDRSPGLRSMYSWTVMGAQLLLRMEEARDDLLALSARPPEEYWSTLEWSYHAYAPVPPVFDYLDRALLNFEGKAALRRCLLRTGLAVEQYGLDLGRFPDRLEELVPHYLRALPRCPLTGVVLSYHDGAVSSPEVFDQLGTWLVRRPDPTPAH